MINLYWFQMKQEYVDFFIDFFFFFFLAMIFDRSCHYDQVVRCGRPKRAYPISGKNLTNLNKEMGNENLPSVKYASYNERKSRNHSTIIKVLYRDRNRQVFACLNSLFRAQSEIFVTRSIIWMNPNRKLKAPIMCWMFENKIMCWTFLIARFVIYLMKS